MPVFGKLIEGFRQFLLQKAREENPPRYIITKFEDLGHVPPEKLERCLAEVKTAFDTVRELRAKRIISGLNQRVIIRRFTWIDNGKTSGKINLGG